MILARRKRTQGSNSLIHCSNQLGYQEQVINRSYQNQIDEINSLVLTELEVREAGFNSLEELQAAYIARTIEQWDQALEELDTSSKSFWETFVEDVDRSTQSFSDLWSSTFNKFTSDFGDAVADAIMNGEGFGDAMEQIAIGFARSMISGTCSNCGTTDGGLVAQQYHP